MNKLLFLVFLLVLRSLAQSIEFYDQNLTITNLNPVLMLPTPINQTFAATAINNTLRVWRIGPPKQLMLKKTFIRAILSVTFKSDETVLYVQFDNRIEYYQYNAQNQGNPTFQLNYTWYVQYSTVPLDMDSARNASATISGNVINIWMRQFYVYFNQISQIFPSSTAVGFKFCKKSNNFIVLTQTQLMWYQKNYDFTYSHKDTYTFNPSSMVNPSKLSVSQDCQVFVLGNDQGQLLTLTFFSSYGQYFEYLSVEKVFKERLSPVKEIHAESSKFGVIYEGPEAGLFTVGSPFNELSTCHWVSGACQYNCSTVPNSITTSFNSVCECKQNYVWVNATCKLDCADPYTVGYSDITGECLCAVGYYFNTSTSQCTINCSNVQKAISQRNQSACLCQKGYVWMGNNNQVCALNCTAANALGTDGQCYCPENSTMINNICQVNCNGIPYSTGINTSNYNSCNCSPGFVWSQSAWICSRDCSNIPYAVSSSLSTICACVSRYIWTDEICALNCSSYPNSAGYNKSNVSACICNPGYEWSSGGCISNATAPLNCSSKNAVEVNGACVCPSNYIWGSSGSCIINCPAIPNTNGTSGTSSCSCVSGYTWNVGQCEVQSGGDSSSALPIAIGVAVPVGVIAVVGIGIGIACWVKKRRMRQTRYIPGGLSGSVAQVPINYNNASANYPYPINSYGQPENPFMNQYNVPPSAAIINVPQGVPGHNAFNPAQPMNHYAPGALSMSVAVPVPFHPAGVQQDIPFAAPNQNYTKGYSHKQTIIHAIPSFSNLDNTCSICLIGKCNARTSCNHVFHSQCIEIWLRKDKSCPNCRASNITYTIR